jgi:hypothetical protein
MPHSRPFRGCTPPESGTVFMITAYTRKSAITATVCGVSFVCAMFISANDPARTNPLGTVFVLTFVVTFYFASWWFLKAKGRSAENMFWLLLGPVGFLILLYLKDHCKDGKPPPKRVDELVG